MVFKNENLAVDHNVELTRHRFEVSEHCRYLVAKIYNE